MGRSDSILWPANGLELICDGRLLAASFNEFKPYLTHKVHPAV
jgi:hypothetical protein